MRNKSPLILWFTDVDKTDKELIGNKAAHLSELAQAHFPIPPGFIITSQAYTHFIEKNYLAKKIYELIATIHFDHPDSLMQISKQIKKLIMDAPLPDTLTHAVHKAYSTFGSPFHHAAVVVKPSFIPEKSQQLAFMGAQPVALNIQGEANILLTMKGIWAALFAPRALSYRHRHQYDHMNAATAVMVQKMINSEQSGVMFTKDPLTGHKDQLIIEAILGHEALLAQKRETPDTYTVSKKHLFITKKIIAKQEYALEKVGIETKQKKIPLAKQEQQKLTDNQILDLALLGKKLEKHCYFAQEVEWACEKDKIYILQSRELLSPLQEILTSDRTRDLLLKGIPASPGLVSGVVKIVDNVKAIGTISRDDILVVKQTIPEILPAMKKAAAIITDTGGKLSHAMLAAKGLRIPTIIGTEHATKRLKPGLIITVNGTNGEIYRGGQLKTRSQKATEITATKLFVQLAKRIDEMSSIIDGIVTTHPSTKDLSLLAQSSPTIPLVYALDEKRIEEKLVAVKQVREDIAFTQLCIILPEKKTLAELKAIKQEVNRAGIHRSARLVIWMRATTPAHIIELEQYKELGIDGLLIDPDALAQHVMGRENPDDSTNPAVLWAIERAIRTAHALHMTTAISYQMASPSFLEKLIAWGISIIITSPENIQKTRALITTIENNLVEQR